jgi:ribosomal protein S18 acetylase RimI-like enzyme
VDIHLIERNIRDMFRTLAQNRPNGQVCELEGLSIAAAGTEFQMFNAAFLNSPVQDRPDLERRIALAALTFKSRKLPWSLWICEQLLPPELHRPLARLCERAKLHLTSEMPAMIAPDFSDRPPQSALHVEPVNCPTTLRDFNQVGAAAFRIPPPWFDEIYDNTARLSAPMQAWVGYHEGKPVSTAATVASPGAIGLYNLATLTPFRQRGFGEALFRHSIHEAFRETGPQPVVLQSTRSGLRLYERMGFQSVGRILVFPSRV